MVKILGFVALILSGGALVLYWWLGFASLGFTAVCFGLIGCNLIMRDIDYEDDFCHCDDCLSED